MEKFTSVREVICTGTDYYTNRSHPSLMLSVHTGHSSFRTCQKIPNELTRPTIQFWGRRGVQPLKPQGYCSRWEFILARCANRNVLHLGFIGETDAWLDQKVDAIKDEHTLHSQLLKVASAVAGVDRDERAVEMIRSKVGWDNLHVADVEHLERLNLNGTFDVVLFGNLVEHLSCPGLALNGIHRFMNKKSEMIISTPNAFALLSNVRFTLGRFREGDEHVTGYSRFMLQTLLERHGYAMTELFTCYDKPPIGWKQKLKFAVGVPYFSVMPERGGTLLAVSRKAV
jgi:SAM-dependent methyltransferase